MLLLSHALIPMMVKLVSDWKYMDNENTKNDPFPVCILFCKGYGHDEDNNFATKTPEQDKNTKRRKMKPTKKYKWHMNAY